MTYSEVLDELEAYSRRREADVKDQMWIQAQMDYSLAKLINIAVWDPKHLPDTVQKAYPGLFPKEEEKLTWQESKEQFKAYAEAHNRQKGGGMQ
jgi:hypothetical protein